MKDCGNLRFQGVFLALCQSLLNVKALHTFAFNMDSWKSHHIGISVRTTVLYAPSCIHKSILAELVA